MVLGSLWGILAVGCAAAASVDPTPTAGARPRSRSSARGPSRPRTESPSLAAADVAYMKLDLAQSRKILNGVLNDGRTAPEDRVAALQRLALQDWKFERDYEQARIRLQDALGRGVNRSGTWQTLSRVERESGHYAAARAAAQSALQTAQNQSEIHAAQLLFARAAHEQLMDDARHQRPLESELLQETHTTLTAMLTAEPGDPEASVLLLGVSLLRRDGPTALKAWRSYFSIPAGQAARGILERPGGTLDRLLPRWQGSDLAPEERTELAVALGQSRLYEYAALIGAGVGPTAGSGRPPAVEEILAYAEFLRQVKDSTDEYYRQVALGAARDGPTWDTQRPALEETYERALVGLGVRLWLRLPFAGARPPFEFERFRAELSRRFGTEMVTGSTSDYQGYVLIMGHRVLDETRSVEQYGYQADLRFVLVDQMVSNGYSSWFWDGKTMIGGWATASTIFQVSGGLNQAALYFWRMLNDRQERNKEEQAIAKESARDDALARDNPYAFLPGLERRLGFDAVRRIYDKVKAQGYAPDELCVAFVAEYVRMNIESTIMAHEGRHAIDQLHFPDQFQSWSEAEREFRAKLSQIVFAPDPKLAMYEILDEGTGGPSGHGQADERLLKTIVAWMAAHRGEIAGLDPARPLLPQFDRLTDDQIRALFRAADPLAAPADRTAQ
jgi:tetratricopeptide (TPR) repeat protein